MLSPGNTNPLTAFNLVEYFEANVQVAWVVECRHRGVAVYTSPTEYAVAGKDETIHGGAAFPGFSSSVAAFFTDLNIGQKPPIGCRCNFTGALLLFEPLWFVVG